MTVAAYSHYLYRQTGVYPDDIMVKRELETLSSDLPEMHNPEKIEQYLISGQCRSKDKQILARRLRSTGTQLICVTCK